MMPARRSPPRSTTGRTGQFDQLFGVCIIRVSLLISSSTSYSYSFPECTYAPDVAEEGEGLPTLHPLCRLRRRRSRLGSRCSCILGFLRLFHVVVEHDIADELELDLEDATDVAFRQPRVGEITDLGRHVVADVVQCRLVLRSQFSCLRLVRLGDDAGGLLRLWNCRHCHLRSRCGLRRCHNGLLRLWLLSATLGLLDLILVIVGLVGHGPYLRRNTGIFFVVCVVFHLLYYNIGTALENKGISDFLPLQFYCRPLRVLRGLRAETRAQFRTCRWLAVSPPPIPPNGPTTTSA